MKISKKVIFGIIIFIFSIALYNICLFADIPKVESKDKQIVVAGVSKLNIAISDSTVDEIISNSTESKNAVGKTSLKNSSHDSNDTYYEEEEETEEINEEYKENIEEVPNVEESSNSESKEKLLKSSEINSSDIPYFVKTETIGYITCKSANVEDVAITYGDDQWIINSYGICMAQDFALPNYFGAGHPVLLAGHNNKYLGYLPNVSIGDRIEVSTVYGGKFVYEVTYSKLVKNYNNETLLDIDTGESVVEFYGDSDILQIYTCADQLGYDLNYRWLVKAKLIPDESTKIL